MIYTDRIIIFSGSGSPGRGRLLPAGNGYPGLSGSRLNRLIPGHTWVLLHKLSRIGRDLKGLLPGSVILEAHEIACGWVVYTVIQVCNHPADSVLVSSLQAECAARHEAIVAPPGVEGRHEQPDIRAGGEHLLIARLE